MSAKGSLIHRIPLKVVVGFRNWAELQAVGRMELAATELTKWHAPKSPGKRLTVLRVSRHGCMEQDVSTLWPISCSRVTSYYHKRGIQSRVKAIP